MPRIRSERVTNFGQQGCSRNRADAGLVTQCGAVLMKELVEVSFELADLTSGGAILLDEREQP